MEYTDPYEGGEIEDWVLSQSATDPLDRATIIPTIVGYSGGNIPSFNSPYKDLPIGEYIINFSATDSRYNAGTLKVLVSKPQQKSTMLQSLKLHSKVRNLLI